MDDLPKCWGLNDAGELVQNVPVVPGMTVYIDDPVVRAATVTKIEVCGIIKIDMGFNRAYGRDEYKRTEAYNCSNSREAAEKREDI